MGAPAYPFMSFCEEACVQPANGLSAFLTADSPVYEDGLVTWWGCREGRNGNGRLFLKGPLLLCRLLRVDGFWSGLAMYSKAGDYAKEDLSLSGI